MFTDDDLDPKTRRAKPRPLDKMSVEELRLYKSDLNAEISRVDAEIAKKENWKSSADGLFKKPG